LPLPGLVMKWLVCVPSIAGAFLILRVDLRRRRLSLSSSSGWHLLPALDVVCPALTASAGISLIPSAIVHGSVPLYSPFAWTIGALLLIFAFIWGEGRRQVQFQRPPGIVLAEWLILVGVTGLAETALFDGWFGHRLGSPVLGLFVSLIVGGAIVIAMIVPAFVKRYEGHRILERLAEQGESVQEEYVAPTPECPRPELWHMVDSQTTELEVIDFLKSLVITVKPRLIVETGTFLAYSTIQMAQGLKTNGFGKIITIEYDPAIFAKAKGRMDASGLSDWIEYRNETSLESQIDGTIDLLFSDSHLSIREQEIRRFLPQIDPRGLIVIHDASSQFRVVREAALRLEQEGLMSVVLLSTPRGMVIAQKRAGRE
jgi:predicted O-methyltransferase YrrM